MTTRTTTTTNNERTIMLLQDLLKNAVSSAILDIGGGKGKWLDPVCTSIATFFLLRRASFYNEIIASCHPGSWGKKEVVVLRGAGGARWRHASAIHLILNFFQVLFCGWIS